MGANGDATAEVGYRRRLRGNSDAIPAMCPQFAPDHPDVLSFRSFARRDADHS
jgi:hypothetical protein